MDRWDGKMSLPLHGALDYSLPFCRTGGYRLFISDKLSFEKSIFHSIEHGPVGNAFPVDYTSLGFYYSDSPVTTLMQPDEAVSTVFIPDTLYFYPQLLKFGLQGNINSETTWKYGTGGLSYLFTADDEASIRLSLDEVPAGKYQLFIDVIKKKDGCDFSLWQRQSKMMDWTSTHRPEGENRENIVAGDIAIDEFRNTLTFRFKTAKDRKGLALNRIGLIRKRKGDLN